MWYSRSWFRLLTAVLLLSTAACSHSLHISGKRAQTYQVKNITPDSALSALVTPYKQELDAKMSEVIGRAETTLTKKQPECTLGNFMADAQLEAARKIDPAVTIAVANYGGIRISYLPEGNIQLRNIYELMPFDNTLVILEIPGTVVQQFCDHMASMRGWPVSGLTYTIKDKKAYNITVSGKPLDDKTRYKIALSDYVANGGDNCHFLKTYTPVLTNIFIRDVLITHVKELTSQNKPLTAHLENRVTNAE